MANEFIVDTKLDAKGIERGAKQARAELARLEKSYEQLKEKESQLTASGKNQQVTKEYKEAAANVDRLGKSLSALYDRQEKYEELGVSKNSRAYKSLQIDIDKLTVKLREAKQEKEALESSKYVNTDAYNKLRSDIEKTGAKIRQARDEVEYWESQTAETASSGGGTNKMSAVIKVANIALESFKKKLSIIGTIVKKVFGGAGSLISKATSSLLSFAKASKRSNGSLSGGFKTILKYTLGIRSLYMLVNKLRSALVDGFKNLAKFNDGVNPVNESLSRLVSALSYLKNSFAAAFAPILTEIEPALTTLVRATAKAVNYVGALFATLAGQGKFIKAKEVQQNFAESLDKTADSAKKAYKSLAKFDELDVYNKDDVSLSTSGNGKDAEEMFEEADTPNIIGDFAEDFAEALERKNFLGVASVLSEKLIDVFTDAVNSFSEKLENFFDSTEWDSIGELIGDRFNQLFEELDTEQIGETIATVVNSLFELVSGFIEEFEFDDAVESVQNFFKGIFENIEFDSIAETIGTFIADILNSITEFFSDENLSDYAVKVGNSISTMIQTALDKISFDNMATAFNNIVISIIRGIKAAITAKPGYWQNVGIKISDAFKKIKWKEIAFEFGGMVTQLVKDIKEFIKGFDWKGAGTAISDMISGVDWKTVAFEFSELVDSIINAVTDFVAGVEWDKVGEAIADIISGIDWKELWFDFKKLCKTIVEAIGSLIGGLLGKDVDPLKTGIVAVLITAAGLILASSLSFPTIGGVIIAAITAGVAAAGISGLVDMMEYKIRDAVSKISVNWQDVYAGSALTETQVPTITQSDIANVIGSDKKPEELTPEEQQKVRDYVGGLVIGSISSPAMANGTIVPTAASQSIAQTTIQSGADWFDMNRLGGRTDTLHGSSGDVYLSTDAELAPLVRALNISVNKEEQRVGKDFQKVGFAN